MSQEKVFQARKDQSFPWFETSQEQQESLVNECGWQGRVLFTEPVAPSVSVDTPEFHKITEAWRKEPLCSNEINEAWTDITDYVERHAAAVAAKAVAEARAEYDRREAGFIAAHAAISSAPQQHAQAALSDEPLAYLTLGGIEDGSEPEFEDNDIVLNSKAVEALQEKLVTFQKNRHGITINLFASVAASQQPAAAPAAAAVQTGQHVTIDGPTFRALPQLRILNKNSMDALIAYVDAALASQASKGAVNWPGSYALKAEEKIFYCALAQTRDGLPIMTDCDQHGAWDVAMVFAGDHRRPKYVWGFDDTAAPSPALAQPVADAAPVAAKPLCYVSKDAIATMRAGRSITVYCGANPSSLSPEPIYSAAQPSPAQGDEMQIKQAYTSYAQGRAAGIEEALKAVDALKNPEGDERVSESNDPILWDGWDNGKDDALRAVRALAAKPAEGVQNV